MGQKIGTPTKKGMKNAAISYAIGAGGGLVYKLVTGITGSGLLGSLGGAVVAGSIVKGDKGENLAMILGFNALNAPSTASAAPASPDSDIM